MWVRALWLTLAVLACVAQRADSQMPALRVRAQLCQPSGRDVCGKRTAKIVFAPARVRIEVYTAQHPDNRRLDYVLLCEGEDLPRAESAAAPVAAMHFVEHRDIGEGTCYGVAALVRVKDGVTTVIREQDGPLQILPRL